MPTQPFDAPAIPVEKAFQQRAVRPIARDHELYVLAALQRVFDGGGQQGDVLNRHHPAKPAHRQRTAALRRIKGEIIVQVQS